MFFFLQQEGIYWNMDVVQWMLESPSFYLTVKVRILSVEMGKELSTALHDCVKKDGLTAFTTV